MKTKMKWMSLMMMAVVTIGIFVACGDDDENGGGSNADYAEMLLGSWKQNYNDGYIMYTFERNGKVTFTDYDNDGI